MFKKLFTGFIVDIFWRASKLDISYSKKTKKCTIVFEVNDKDFEIIKDKLIDKVSDEIEITE